jgi:hypothetical protein
MQGRILVNKRLPGDPQTYTVNYVNGSPKNAWG